MSTAKVLMIMCTGEMNYSRTTDDWTALALTNEKRGILGAAATLRSNNGAAARREAAELLLSHPGFTHLQFIDSDQGFPYNTTQRLLAHNKDIVGACYRRRGNAYDMMVFPLHVKELNLNKTTGLIQSRALPTGVSLFSRKVFEVMGPAQFVYDPDPINPGRFLSEDVSFCNRAREAGFKIWTDMDLSREVVHYATVPLRYS